MTVWVGVEVEVATGTVKVGVEVGVLVTVGVRVLVFVGNGFVGVLVGVTVRVFVGVGHRPFNTNPEFAHISYPTLGSNVLNILKEGGLDGLYVRKVDPVVDIFFTDANLVLKELIDEKKQEEDGMTTSEHPDEIFKNAGDGGGFWFVTIVKLDNALSL